MKIKRIKSTEVKIEKNVYENDKNFYCLSVPGKSFVVQDINGNKSITGNSLHVSAMTQLFRAFCSEHPRIVTDEFKKSIYTMAKQIVKLEDAFIEMAMKEFEIEGMTKEDLHGYMRYITDRRLIGLGLKPVFKVKENPIPWLEWIVNAADHTNFFENKVAEYDVAGLQGTWDYDNEN